MTEHLAAVRKFAANADEKKVAAIVKHLGIALRKRDSSLVAGSDPKELLTVRESWCKRKLGLSGDAELDAGIKKVMTTMKAERDKSRVVVYYLLAEHFNKLDALG